MFVFGISASLCSSSGSKTCATISPGVKFRINPSCAVKQNWQSTAHPACVEMQIVCRPSLGMNTASTEAGRDVARSSPGGSANKYRTEPSIDSYRCRITGNVTRASFPSRSLNADGSFDICAISNFRSTYSAWYSCAPRYAGSPNDTHSAVSSAFDFPNSSVVIGSPQSSEKPRYESREKPRQTSLWHTSLVARAIGAIICEVSLAPPKTPVRRPPIAL